MFPLVARAAPVAQFKNYLARYENMVAIFSLARDRWRGGGDGDGDGSERERENTEGRVTLDPTTGEPIFSRTCHPSDRDSLVKGLIVARQVLLTAVVGEIVSSIRGLPPYLHPKGEPRTTINTTTTTPEIRIKIPVFRAWQKSSAPSLANPTTSPSAPHTKWGQTGCAASAGKTRAPPAWESALMGRYGGVEGPWNRKGECMGWRECGLWMRVCCRGRPE
ncbi:hypothetical protein L211DRAFT_641457 [Terfezia boudieri ATCC MYA-4762]|uniref:Uncharacterized protein n=1 Tax=Terfezia boudieri ATCC MYA-4762 TaxID=1051890 RepID=A0A3N4LMU0_9PEZI|nr:hypothetical protein L211DRAFT_641457 [Terfezia boudieri ATCC MYA-4762]